MENKAHALAAGLFTLLLGAALVVTVMWFANNEEQSTFYKLFATGSVSGLKTDAPVRYRGVDVGRVTAIGLEPGKTGRIQLEIGVRADTPITPNTYAQLGYQGITGIAYVQLNEDAKLASVAGELKPDQIRMKPSLLDEGEALFNTMTALTDKLGNLFDGKNQEKMRNALDGIEQIAQRASEVTRKIEPTIAGVPALVADTRGLANEARASLSEVRASLKRVDRVADNAERLMDNANRLALKLDQRLASLDQLAVAAREAGSMMNTLNSDSIPRANALIDDLARETRAIDRAVDRVVDTVVEQPQGFVFGAPPAKPGPGEPGFNGGN